MVALMYNDVREAKERGYIYSIKFLMVFRSPRFILDGSSKI